MVVALKMEYAVNHEVGAVRRTNDGSHRWLRRFAGIVAAATVSSGLLVTVTATAASANTDESAFIRDTNAARAAHGLAPLAVYSDLTSIARNWSAHMAATNTLAHNPNLASQVQNWQVVGENVGVGPDESSIQTAFMNSPEHRANILDSEYTQFGVGTVRDSKGQLWVTVDFRDPMNAPAPTVSHSAPPPPVKIVRE